MAKDFKIRRKELKQPDQFISLTDLILTYCGEHKRLITSGVLILFFLIFIGFFLNYSSGKKDLEMETLYFEIEKIIAKKSSDTQEIITNIESILSKFRPGSQKQRAIMILANQYYDIRQYDKAISLYQDVVSKTSPMMLQYQLANTGIAYSFEGKKKYTKAIITYRTIIQSQSEYPVFHIYLSLVRCYELSNDRNGALLTLREMKTRFPNHPGIETVDYKLNKIEKMI